MPQGLLKIRFLLLSGLLTLIVSAGLFNYASAQSDNDSYDFLADSGLKNSGQAAGYDTVNPPTVDELIGNIILTALSLLGVIFFILIIYGGFTWMTAHGNEDKVKTANKIIMSSLMGLIITLAAYGLSFFLIEAFWK